MGHIQHRSSRAMSNVPPAANVERLRGQIAGQVILPDHPEYDQARQIWNGMIQRLPAVIVRCAKSSDVTHAINFARDHDLPVSIRGGGHNIAGLAVSDGGLMVDFSAMRGVTVDETTRRVRVQPGAVLGDLDRATQQLGLIVPSGVISATGVAGLTLGGGFGWLTRKWGHTSDHLRSAEIVTADGETLHTSDTSHDELFWGLRGGGGNFGVVTEFEFEARPLGPAVTAGLVLYPMDEAASVIRVFTELTALAPEDLTTLLVLRIAPPAPFLPESVHGKPVAGIAVCYAGPVEDAERHLGPLRSLGEPLVDTIKPKPFVEHQSLFDSGQPNGRHYYWKSEYLSRVSTELGSVLIDESGKFPSPHSSVLLMQLGGAAKRTPASMGAVSHRSADFIVAIQAAWDDPTMTDTSVRWAREFHANVRPFSTGGVYVNFLTEDEGDDRVREAYDPETLAHLAQVKARYDPGNFFRLNKNVAPARVAPPAD